MFLSQVEMETRSKRTEIHPSRRKEGCLSSCLPTCLLAYLQVVSIEMVAGFLYRGSVAGWSITIKYSPMLEVEQIEVIIYHLPPSPPSFTTFSPPPYPSLTPPSEPPETRPSRNQIHLSTASAGPHQIRSRAQCNLISAARATSGEKGKIEGGVILRIHWDRIAASK